MTLKTSRHTSRKTAPDAKRTGLPAGSAADSVYAATAGREQA